MKMTLQRRRRIREVLIAAALLFLVLPSCGGILPFAAAFISPAVVVVVSSSSWNHNHHHPNKRMWPAVLNAAAAKKKMVADSRPRNEFSRTIQPDRIIRITRGGASSSFRMSLQANETECQDLAKRFGLTNVSKLEASVLLRPESLGGGSSGSGSGSAAAAATSVVDLFGGVEAHGTVLATITQVCVRTNEKFQVDLEFPLYAIVRPTIGVGSSQYYNSYSDDDDDDIDVNVNEDDEYEAVKNSDNSKGNNNNNNNKKRKKSSRGSKSASNNNLNEMDLLQLQRMMQEDIISMENNDALMQDESIYPAGGLLDVGELVTQLFFLNIDPYPKKPGTDGTSGVQQKWSISG
jgi:hypothetical protein